MSSYVYEYPRSDGHNGYLLFSKGEDKKSSSFTSELTSTPEKQSIDNDNIPPSRARQMVILFVQIKL